jgi:DNA-binding MarR family transcriptional regulator
MSTRKPSKASHDSRHDYRRLDPLLASRIRLAAMTLLATTEGADFSYLKLQTGTSDGNLGGHMRKLIDAGYVSESKSFQQRRPNTFYCLTDDGRQALDNYLSQLRCMLDDGASS